MIVWLIDKFKPFAIFFFFFLDKRSNIFLILFKKSMEICIIIYYLYDESKSIRERKAYPYYELTNGSAVSDETRTNIVKLTYLSMFTA